MKLLTVDTSTTACSVALTDDGRLLGEYLLNLDRTLSERLIQSIKMLLKDAGLVLAELDGFGVALGPGSFTGLRIGVATVKGMAFATGKPVAGFSSLAMLAMNLPWASYPVCPMFDARKHEVYAAIYKCLKLPEPVIADCVTPPDAFLEKITGPAIFIGEGAIRYREVIISLLGDRALFAPASIHMPRSAAGDLLVREAFAKGATIPLATLAPAYIRPSEAELAKLKQ